MFLATFYVVTMNQFKQENKLQNWIISTVLKHGVFNEENTEKLKILVKTGNPVRDYISHLNQYWIRKNRSELESGTKFMCGLRLGYQSELNPKFGWMGLAAIRLILTEL